ncbi:hypothetical protein ATDW_01140 [Asticcacaulis sp. DW145]|uniref:hypothetical protein n=1 Tax=Asticcacaulis sp. DW145 TaxID=3095608 RepID=UPI00308CF2CA|nr:hypothetical protein ATDW_01140 [Asticcacaulis sp. DW145]
MALLAKQIRTIDASISIFENSQSRKRKRGYVTERYRFMVSYLREASGPVTVPEIVASWANHKGLITNPEIRNDLRRRVRSALCKLRTKGVVVQVGEMGKRKMWRLIKDIDPV